MASRAGPRRRVTKTKAHCLFLRYAEDVGRKAQANAVGKASAATQSIYSEREAQTTPYSPPTEIAEGQKPEELAIAYFCWERGLPATQLEISIIQRMRQQRKIENLLPPTTDEYSFQARSALMEEQEFREWSDRENHIKKLHVSGRVFVYQLCSAQLGAALRVLPAPMHCTLVLTHIINLLSNSLA